MPRRTSSVLSYSWTSRKPRQVLHFRSQWEAHRNHGSRQAHRSVLNFSHNSPSRSRKELPRSNPRQEPGNGTPTTDGTNCSLLQLVAGHREGQSPETGTLGVGLAQSVVDLRYQNRARKSSLHVMKPGLVGECTIQRTMLLWPRESRFLRSAVLESQQQRLMVLSSGSKI